MERNAGYSFHREAECHTRIYLVCGQKTSQSQLQRGVRVIKNPSVGRSLPETLVVSCCSESCPSQALLKLRSCGIAELDEGSEGRVRSQLQAQGRALSTSGALRGEEPHPGGSFIPDNPVP